MYLKYICIKKLLLKKHVFRYGIKLDYIMKTLILEANMTINLILVIVKKKQERRNFFEIFDSLSFNKIQSMFSCKVMQSINYVKKIVKVDIKIVK